MAQVKDAVTVDIGGTTTDVGILKNGEPINENSRYELAGIKLNSTSPRFNSFALGGGTVISKDEYGNIKVGPESVGREIFSQSLAFGGSVLTPTDIAIYFERLSFENVDTTAFKKALSLFSGGEDPDIFIKKVDRALHEKLVEGIQLILDSMEHIPPNLVLVGGGAKLLDIKQLEVEPLLQRFRAIIIPDEGSVANALGAARSMIGATYKKLYYLAKDVLSQENALQETKHLIRLRDAENDAFQEAKRLAILLGAEENSIFKSSVNQVPFSYLPGDPSQISVTAVGRDGGHDLGVVQNTSPIVFPSRHQDDFQATANSNIGRFMGIQGQPLKIDNLRSLTTSDIDDIAWGAGILGAGGGANPEFARLMSANILRQGKQIRMVSCDDLPDEALAVLCGGMGSPNILSERLITSHEGSNVIKMFEEKIGRKIDVLVVIEAGGTNALYPLFMGGLLDIPVVDADCMGRAFPQLHMMTPYIYGDIQKTQLTMSNGLTSQFVEANGMKELESAARQMLVDMGCVVSIALLPMSGKEVHSQTIRGTMSLLQQIGASLKVSQRQPFNMRLEALNEVLADSEYEKAVSLCEGKIRGLHRSEEGGFSMGGFTIHSSPFDLEVGFQNENLFARNKDTGEIIAQVPDLITIVDKNTFQVISCEDLRYGLDVAVLKLTAPKILKTEQALKVLGPEAFPLAKLFAFLDSM